MKNLIWRKKEQFWQFFAKIFLAFLVSILFLSVLFSSVLSQAFADSLDTVAHTSRRIETEKPFVLAILGDSRTEGVFADMPLGQVLKRDHLVQNAALEFFLRRLLFVSLPAASSEELIFSRQHMKRVQKFFSRRALSGIAGNKVYSLPERLQGATQRPVQVRNYAEPGLSYLVASTDVVFEIGQKERTQKHSADAIAIELGAVDFLINLNVEDFQNAVRDTLNRLAIFMPHTEIYLSNLPNIVQLFLESDHPALYSEQGQVLKDCQALYEETGYGQDLALSPNASPESIEFQRKRFEDFQHILKNEVDRLNDQAFNLGYTKKAHLVTLQKPEKIHDYLAFDCLHPNPVGQAKTADVFFEKMMKNISP